MESKLKNENIINIVIGAIFLILGLLTAYYTITFITLDNPKTMSSSNPLKINDEIYQQLKSPANFGDDVSLDEPGFGRVDPFSPF